MLAKFSVKKPYTVIVAIILVIALGVISFLNMQTDLLPSMDLPYVIVYTVDTGSTPEAVEDNITRPLESAFATLTDIKNVTSTSSENLSLVVLEFTSGADMNTAMIEIDSEIDQVSGSWDDNVSEPVVMKLNPNMIPVTISAVNMKDSDLLELSDYIEDELIPSYEALDGVASVTASGVMTQQVDITIEQSRIDTLNSAILKEVDSQLADAEEQLRDAQDQINQGKSTLSDMRVSTLAQIDEAITAIDNGETQLPLAIATLNSQREQLVPQLEAAQAAADQLKSSMELSDDEKAAAEQINAQLESLKSQRDELQAQLDSGSTDALQTQLASLQSQRASTVNIRSQEASYLANLQVMDQAALEKNIADLETTINSDNEKLAAIRSSLETAITERDQAQRDLNDLDAQIADLQSKETGTTTGKTTEDTVSEPTQAPTDDPDSSSDQGSPETADPGTEQGSQEDPNAGPEQKTQQGTDAGTEQNTPAQGSSENSNTAAEPAQVAWNISLFPTAYAESVTLAELQAQRVQVQTRFDTAQAQVDSLTEQHDALRETLTQEDAALESAKSALADFEAGELAVQKEIEDTRSRIAEYDAQIADLDTRIAQITQDLADGNVSDTLTASIAELDTQISALETSDAYKLYQLISDPSALNSQYEQAEAAVAQLQAGITSIDDMLAKLDQGIIPAGMIDGITEDTKLSDAKTQLQTARETAVSAFASASSQLSDAESQISDAWKEFEDARDEALENAGIDGIVTVSTVGAILGAQNFDMPAGYVSDADGKYLVSVGTEFASLSELKQTKLFSLGLETVDDVRLLDVASVTISDNSEDIFTLLNGQDGVLLSFEKQSTASTAEVAKLITAKSEELMKENPRLDIIELMNQGDYIDLIVDSVLQNLLYGGGLAILILLLFLMDWRPTLIIAISIPTSVVVAFVGMYFCGITLNVMSLSGLALGVGMLVDNSIVAIENIYRLRNEEDMPVLTACIQGVKQVGGALIASTLTTVCIFLPIVFIQGTARELFSGMGLTFAFALLASLLVAMTVVPSFSATLFRNSKPKEHKIFDRIQRGYSALLRGALRVKWLVLLPAAGLLVYTCMQVPNMAMSLMPSVNSTQMEATLSFSGDSDLTDKEEQEIAEEIMTRMLDVQGVTDIGLAGSSSISMLSSMTSGGSGYSYYILVEEGQRDNADIAADMRKACADLADGETVKLDVQESTMDMTSMMGSGISVDIYGEDIPTLRAAAAEIAKLCEQVKGAKDIDDGSSEAEPKLVITVDKELATDQGLTVAQVYQYIAQRLYGESKLTEATLDGRDYTLYIQTDKNIDLQPNDLAGMEMEVQGTDSTKHVLISDIASITDSESLDSISRSNQKRKVSVSFELEDGYSSNLVSRDLEAVLADYTPPEGVTIDISGENENLMEYMVDLIEMLAVAILFIFLIMVAQFQSFKSPVIVMFTIPLAFTGGLLMLQITGMDLSIIAMVGFLMLSGVVVNNGIVFIDSVNQLRIGGMHKRDALIETGRIRLRPILMSVLTTVLGMLTMALGTGMGAEMMQPMAVVTIGGLVYSTLMTLFVVPALYDLFNGEQMKAREIEMVKEASGMKREGFDNL